MPAKKRSSFAASRRMRSSMGSLTGIFLKVVSIGRSIAVRPADGRCKHGVEPRVSPMTRDETESQACAKDDPAHRLDLQAGKLEFRKIRFRSSRGLVCTTTSQPFRQLPRAAVSFRGPSAAGIWRACELPTNVHGTTLIAAFARRRPGFSCRREVPMIPRPRSAAYVTSRC